ncbi:hypothetical protein [Sphingomonas mali]|uniref:hypothetical protein n=1 Tax=Sphingomonas mali TaxID=40682 RepID=UPI00082F142D|nr:hypothetical protein [Sphingomonas mali]
MQILLVIVESIGLVVGSIAAAILLCWLLWSAFRLIRHPAWGPPIVILPVILWAANMLPRSEFLRMTLVFALLAAIPFWIEGRAWRAAWIERKRPGVDEPLHG